MTKTFSQNIYHIVFSTKQRFPFLLPEFQSRVFEYIAGCLQKSGCKSIIVNGIADHVHILVAISPDLKVSEVVRDVKIATSKWLKYTFNECRNFSWQEGYASFTVSKSQVQSTYEYILNQEEHHKHRTFKDEYIIFLKKHEIDFEEKYLWS